MSVYCKKCKLFFAAEELKESWSTDLDTWTYEIKRVCPLCGGEHIILAKNCLRCKEDFVGKGALCIKCIKELKEELEEFLKKYSIEEQEAMLEYD